jgi:predicted nucleotidyltransferase
MNVFDCDLIKKSEHKFLEQALTFHKKLGNDSIALLVGSRAAGYMDSWSDLDIWIIGKKEKLNARDKDVYKKTGQIFVDRGDAEAHFTFKDIEDLRKNVENWKDPIIWLIKESKVLDGKYKDFSVLKNKCKKYPRKVAEQKLKTEIGRYVISKAGSLVMAPRNGDTYTSIISIGKVLESIFKISCYAEQLPVPYTKWLFRVSQDTTITKKILPLVSGAVSNIEEIIRIPEGKYFRELVPVKNLRGIKGILVESLLELGWKGDWVKNPDDCMEYAF